MGCIVSFRVTLVVSILSVGIFSCAKPTSSLTPPTKTTYQPVGDVELSFTDSVFVTDPITFSIAPPYYNDYIYHWDFGNGNSRTGSTTYYAYSDPGTYTITVTVNGRTDSPIIKEIHILPFLKTVYTYNLAHPRKFSGGYQPYFQNSHTVTDSMLSFTVIDSGTVSLLGATTHCAQIDTINGLITYNDQTSASYVLYYYKKDSIYCYGYIAAQSGHAFAAYGLHTP